MTSCTVRTLGVDILPSHRDDKMDSGFLRTTSGSSDSLLKKKILYQLRDYQLVKKEFSCMNLDWPEYRMKL
jgi:hypothetical protein